MTETPERASTEQRKPATAAAQAGGAGEQSKPAAAKPRPVRRPRPSPLAVITTALGLFLIVLTLLAIQVRKGRDPALGAGPMTPSLTKPSAKSAKSRATTIVSRTSPAPPP